jgi:hypothetical protein
MATFKILLLDPSGEVIEAKDVRAIRNYEAIAAAVAWCRLTLRRSGGYEVWRNGRKIARRLLRH